MRDSSSVRAITSKQIEEYDHNGVVRLAGAFDPGWIDFLRDAVDQAMAEPGPYAEEYAKGEGRFFGDLDVAKRHHAFREFVFHSPAAQIIGTLMQSTKVNFFYDQLLVKEPGTREKTPWHQDQPYWAVSGVQVASIWLPLDFVARESAPDNLKTKHLTCNQMVVY